MGAANVPAVLAYSANNTVSHSKRGISSAVVIGMGGVGGIFAATIYRQVDSPGYLCVRFFFTRASGADGDRGAGRACGRRSAASC